MILSHYCSNDAFVSIISNREIWVSELSLSNDYLEGKWLRNIFSAACGTDVSAENIPKLLNHLDVLMTVVGGAGFCLSEESDQLSQWRGYANNGAGMSIGFDSDYFEKLSDEKSNDRFGFKLSKMVYDVEEQKREISEPLQRILKHVEEGALDMVTLLDDEADVQKKEHAQKALRFAFLFFFPYVYSLKNPAFREEREWRLLSHLARVISSFREMEYRATADRIVPFIRVPLYENDISAIRQIVIGPRNLTPVELVRAFVEKHGFKDVQVLKSTASYR